MTMSPASSLPARSRSVASTTAAGTINHTARGLCSLFTRSSSEAAGVAPSWATSFTDSALRSKTTHWWPAFCSRRAMLAPIRPSPIIPSCIAIAPVRYNFFKPNRRRIAALRQSLSHGRSQRGESRCHVFAEVHAQCASPALGKDGEIPARLRRLDNTECVFLFRHGEVIGVVAGNLQEDTTVRPALVSLARRVQEPRTKSQDCRYFLRVPDQMADGLECRFIAGVHGDVAQEREIISVAHPLEMGFQDLG